MKINVVLLFSQEALRSRLWGGLSQILRQRENLPEPTQELLLLLPSAGLPLLHPEPARVRLPEPAQRLPRPGLGEPAEVGGEQSAGLAVHLQPSPRGGRRGQRRRPPEGLYHQGSDLQEELRAGLPALVKQPGKKRESVMRMSSFYLKNIYYEETWPRSSPS